MTTQPSPTAAVIGVLWPAFFMAGVLTMALFAAVDPATLVVFGRPLDELPRQAVYTLSFFVFWVAIALASGMTTLLARR